jgi:hypothetical protein
MAGRERDLELPKVPTERPAAGRDSAGNVDPMDLLTAAYDAELGPYFGLAEDELAGVARSSEHFVVKYHGVFRGLNTAIKPGSELDHVYLTRQKHYVLLKEWQHSFHEKFVYQLAEQKKATAELDRELQEMRTLREAIALRNRHAHSAVRDVARVLWPHTLVTSVAKFAAQLVVQIPGFASLVPSHAVAEPESERDEAAAGEALGAAADTLEHTRAAVQKANASAARILDSLSKPLF